MKSIKDICIGDFVFSDVGKKIAVKKIYKTDVDKQIIINNHYICSDTHRFETNNGLKEAKNLCLTDKLKANKKTIILENGLEITNENFHLILLF